MNIEKAKFSNRDLQEIDKADDLKISPLRADGVTHGTPTWIWEVVVDDNLYVRAYNGTGSRWFQSAIEQKAGQIHVAGMIKDVHFERIEKDELLQAKIDEAYKSKYGSSPYLGSMISDRAKNATIKISPTI